ncbi:MAG: GNAT family N-acetyltransferase [Rhodospirillaceae bacterium]|nr:GNAT family N-acetyltransferase [Rhodospirillaceae bacterium]
MLDLNALSVLQILTTGAVQHRLAIPEDVPTLTAWRRVYDRITMGFPQHTTDDARTERMFNGAIEDQTLWVFKDKSIVVAMASLNAVRPDTVQVGCVFTPEENRSRGYARSVVAGSLADAQVAGVTDAILFTKVDNIAAQKIYESLRFVRVRDYAMLVLNPS